MEVFHLNKTREIVEAGLFSVIIAIGMILMFYLPIGQSIIAVLLPMPVVIMMIRNRASYAILAVICATLVSGFMITFVASLTLGILVLASGYPLGLAIKKRASNLRSLLIGTLGVLLGILLMFTMTELITGISMKESMNEMFKMTEEMQTELLKYSSNLGESSEKTNAEMKSILKSLILTMKMLMPSILIIFSMLIAAVNLVFSKMIMKRLKIDHVPLGKFEDFRYPKHLAYGSAAMLGLAFIVGKLGLISTEALLSNFIYLFTIVFSIQGIALIYSFMKKGAGKVGSVLLIVLLAFIGLFQYISFLGFFDVLIDIRNISKKKPE